MIEYERIEHLAQFRRQFIDIFEQVDRYIGQFIVFQNEDQRTVIVNWIVHTYLVQLFEYTPYLHIFSAQKQCGKTLLLNLINELSSKSTLLMNFSEPIFRWIDKEEPTLCIDEVDRWDKESKEQIWGIINSGFFRRGGQVMRVTGNSHTPTLFNTFCCKAISGIDRNSIPDTVQDRSIPIELVRKLDTEPTKRFRNRQEVNVIDEIRMLLEPLTEYTREMEEPLFDESHENALVVLYEDEIKNDRALDIVEPLVVVASLGSAEWLNKTINACINLTNREDEEDYNLDLEILRVCNHIRMLNIGQKVISSADLVDEIHKQKDSELAYLNNWGIDQSYLAKRLKVFGIKSKTVRIDEVTTKKGYQWSDFVEPVTRYLPNYQEETQ